MKRFTLLLASAVLSLAQVVPNRYIVEFSTEPAAAVSAAKHQRFASADAEVQSRRLQIRTEHAAAQKVIESVGGTVTHHFDTVLNGMAVTMTPDVAAQVRQMPGVKSVAPVTRKHASLDHAVNVHQVPQAWQSIANGSSSAGAGIKIAILDSGIDITHPAFQGFSTPLPAGFPLGTNDAEKANTNNKVIVSRFYSDPDPNFGINNTTAVPCTALDASADCGHGTSTSMIAAGLSSDPQIPGISPLVGVASGAWLGNYKVLDDNGSGTDVTLLAALQDAVSDGMDVVNYSVGGPVLNKSDESGPVASAIQNALNAGLVFVSSAGNNGQAAFNGQPATAGAGSIEAPAVSAAAIAAGANENERFFFNSVTVGSLPPVVAIEPQADLSNFSGQVTGTVVDVTTLDNNGFGCSAFAANSLSNNIALIQRGPKGTNACTFDAKVSNARNAGAAGVIVYDHTDEPIIDYTLDTGFDPALFSPGLTAGTLPMLFVSLKDGQALKAAVGGNSGVQGTLDMDGVTPLPRPFNVVADFSSAGPSSGAHMKPDVLAVGDAFITADATANGFPFLYGGGTSFSAPLVTGSIALVKSARPGLTAAQYRSLVINSAAEFDNYADGSIAPPEIGGSGLLNVMGALQNNLAASPTSIDFIAAAKGGGTGSFVVAKDAAAQGSVTQALTLTNVGSSSDSFTVTIQALGGGQAPSVDSASFSLDPGKSATVNVSLSTAGLAAGQYHGFILIRGSQTSVATRIPYWFGVAGSSSQTIDLLRYPPVSSAGNAETIFFRVADAAGLPFEPVGNPAITSSNSRARVVDIQPIGDIAGTFAADIVVGRADSNGINTFTISVDNITLNVIIFVQ